MPGRPMLGGRGTIVDSPSARTSAATEAGLVSRKMQIKQGDGFNGLSDGPPPANGPRASVQIAGLTTLIALSDDSQQSPAVLGTVPFPKLGSSSAGTT